MPNAAENLLRYLEDQSAAAGVVPSDREILIERCRDELGDWRLCVLTPFGSRVHAPWCMAVTARLRAERGMEVETMWSDDGFVIRLPDTEEPLESEMLLPSAAELRDLVLRQLGSTSLFAAKFREAAGRALLFPRRRPGLRAPLWQQRKRAADLLAVAARYSSFPILLETYRECVREVLDLASAADVLKKIERGTIRVTTIESAKPSPFASALLFSYIANYIYEGDAPLAERRAQALSIDQSQLEEILGSTDFRELLDKSAMEEVEAQLQSLDPDYQARHADGLHDLLLKLGDLTEEEIAARSATPEVAATIAKLAQARRVVRVRIAREARFIPVEYAARYRDALGTPLPPGLAETFLEPSPRIRSRRSCAAMPARTDPSPRSNCRRVTASRPPKSKPCCAACTTNRKLLEGEFRPGGVHREWCDPDVLQQIRRKTLARLRREVVPAEQHVFARLLARWQGVTVPRRGLDALLDAIENSAGRRTDRLRSGARNSARARGRLQIVGSGRAARLGRNRLGGQGATGQSRWPRFALSGGIVGQPAGPGLWRCFAGRPLRKSAANPGIPAATGSVVSSHHSSGARAAASPMKPPMRSGNWCGPAWSPTTPFSRCALCFLRRRRSVRECSARTCRQARRASCSARERVAAPTAWAKAAGPLCSSESRAGRLRRSGAPPSRSRCWCATAS